MFERTAALWRRLTGHVRAEPACDLQADQERRGWVRYPSDMQIHYSLMGSGQESALSAQVRDVSLGGIQFIADRSVEPGTMLTITLPGDGNSSLAVLACVVHCRQVADQEWTVGCSFSAEIQEWQLRAFGANKAGPAAGDGRGSARFTCNVKAFCQVPDEPDQPPFETRVLNVSRNGMALEVDRELLTGTLLSADLHGAHGGAALTILACVVHVTTQMDGLRITGCNFIRELTEQDLELLL